MSGTLTIDGLVMPADISRLETFRAWVRTLGENAPRVHFSNGSVWIEMSPQNYQTHLIMVDAINAQLQVLSRDLGTGKYFGDGGWLTNDSAGLSTEPDGFLVLWETLRSSEARLVPRAEGEGSIELVGRGDMVLEVVSDSSVHKDTVELIRDYAAAGFREYWLVDAREEKIAFRILALRDGEYEDVSPVAGGWLPSAVWGRRFKLVREIDPAGLPSYDLLVES
ncbi:MAG: Uma2 family endonuclease [Planctomycetes bacterium]|nr:Uma2 family endonuclease [Planctomycetota bacterium]